MDGWKNKLLSVIKGPGWYPGTPWTGNLHEVPDTTGRKPHSYKPFSLPLNVYVIVHFVISGVAYLTVDALKENLSPVSLVCHLAFITVTLGSMGMHFDGNPLAPYTEFIRCTFLYLYSLNGVELLNVAWDTAGLSTILDNCWHSNIHLFLKSYSLLSAVGWGLVCTSLFFKMSKTKTQ